MATIYRKTPKGQTEIETRALRLAPRIRSLLILVDGRRSDLDLAQLMPQAGTGALEKLAEAGFIEAILVTAPDPRFQPRPATPAVVVPAPAVAAPAPAPVIAPGPAAAPQATPPATFAPPLARWPDPVPVPPPAPAQLPQMVTPAFEQHRREAVQALNELCGSSAEQLAVRMERARSPQELMQLLDPAIQLVAIVRGRQPAIDYGVRFKGG